MLVLSTLPILPAVVLIATLAGCAACFIRTTDARPWSRNLPRAFFGLPPRAPVGPRYGLLALIPSILLELVAGWVAVVHPASLYVNVALALAVTPVPASLAALGLWHLIGDRGHSQRVRRNMATVAMAFLPPPAAALIAGLTGSVGGLFAVTTVTVLLSLGIAAHAWRHGVQASGSLWIVDTPPASPFVVDEKLEGHRSQPPWARAHGSHEKSSTDMPVLAAPGTATNTSSVPNLSKPNVPPMSPRRTHARTDSMLSELTNPETMPEWSFSFGGGHSGVSRSAHGQRESQLYGLSEVEEESEGHSHDCGHDDDHHDQGYYRPSVDSHVHPRDTGVGRTLVAANCADNTAGDITSNVSGPSPFIKDSRHTRNPSTPHANDYSVLATYSPNPFTPLPRGFESLTTLTTLPESSDTLALCNSRTRLSAVPPGATPRTRNTSAATTHTHATDSTGPLTLQLAPFASTSSINLPHMGDNLHAPLAAAETNDVLAKQTPTRTVQPPFSPPKQPKGPKGPRPACVNPPFDDICDSNLVSPVLPAAAGLGDHAPVGNHFLRRAPQVLPLSPIPGTPVESTPMQSPLPPSPERADSYPRNLWLLAGAGTLVCYVLAAPLLITHANTATLTAFTASLLVPSPLLTLAIFYPRPRSVTLPLTKTARNELSFENIDIESEGLRATARSSGVFTSSTHQDLPGHYLPAHTADDLFPFSNIPPYPRPVADRHYPYHAYHLKATLHRPHTVCDGDVPTVASQWVGNHHAREGLDRLGRLGEMLKPQPALCVMEPPHGKTSAPPSSTVSTSPTAKTHRDRRRQSLIARLRGGIVSMVERTETQEKSDSRPTSTLPQDTRSPSKAHRSKQRNNSGSGQSISDADMSRETDVTEGGGVVAQIEIATRGHRTSSPSFVITKDGQRVDLMTKEVLTNLGVGPSSDSHEEFERDKHAAETRVDTEAAAECDSLNEEVDMKSSATATEESTNQHGRLTSIDLPFRPSMDAVQSTPRRRYRAHKRQSSSLSTMFGNDQLDFSRPSNEPPIDYAVAGPAFTVEFARPTTIIDVNSTEAVTADRDCAESIFRSAAIARQFLGDPQGNKAWETLKNSSTYLRAMRGGSGSSSLSGPGTLPMEMASIPQTPIHVLKRLHANSALTSPASSSNTHDGDRPSHGSCATGSIASLVTVDTAGVEEMEQVMEMDTPARARWVSTPASSIHSGSAARSRLSAATVMTDNSGESGPTARKRFISNASTLSGTSRTSGETPNDGTESTVSDNGPPPLPPLPNYLSSAPSYPSSLYIATPNNPSGFFHSTESLAAVLERSFEEDEYSPPPLQDLLPKTTAAQLPATVTLPGGLPGPATGAFRPRARRSTGAFSVHSDKDGPCRATRGRGSDSVLISVGNTTSTTNTTKASTGSGRLFDKSLIPGVKKGNKGSAGSGSKGSMGSLSLHSKGSIVAAPPATPKTRSLARTNNSGKENMSDTPMRPHSTHAFPYSMPWDDNRKHIEPNMHNVRGGRGRVVRALGGLRM